MVTQMATAMAPGLAHCRIFLPNFECASAQVPDVRVDHLERSFARPGHGAGTETADGRRALPDPDQHGQPPHRERHAHSAPAHPLSVPRPPSKLRLTGFYWVLLGSTGFYWVLLRFTTYS